MSPIFKTTARGLASFIAGIASLINCDLVISLSGKLLPTAYRTSSDFSADAGDVSLGDTPALAADDCVNALRVKMAAITGDTHLAINSRIVTDAIYRVSIIMSFISPVSSSIS